MDENLNFFSQILDGAGTNDAMPLPMPKGFYRSRIYTSNTSINPLIVACDPILTLASTLKTIEYPSNRDKFLEDLAHEIRAFEHRAQIANYSKDIITAASYALCSLLDETIALTSEWGKDENWLQTNLLRTFHNKNYTDKYFFTIIDYTLKNTTTNLHLIELLYLCLSLGFAGKYRNNKQGKSKLESISNNLYKVICQYRRINNRSLFIYDPQIKLPPAQQDYRTNFIPQFKTITLLGVAAALALIISGIIYLGIHLQLHNISQPLYPLIEHGIISKNNGVNPT